MSTRAQIAIQTGPEEWAHVYVHFDGYPAHMLPALARWKPEDTFVSHVKDFCHHAPAWNRRLRRLFRESSADVRRQSGVLWK